MANHGMDLAEHTARLRTTAAESLATRDDRHPFPAVSHIIAYESGTHVSSSLPAHISISCYAFS